MSEDVKRLLCLACGGTVAVTAVESLSACPSCGDRGVPADTDDVVALTITTHELRVLTMWASNWARTNAERHPVMPKVAQGICDRLQPFTEAALALTQEVADLRAALLGQRVEVRDASGRVA